ncbi:hypothetical protein RI129_001809 [Pyrocoelia pectoralis]|uniref:Uncharacterized protein n=1 Tax=Pyrocoelia pectoralis TaxID=417401 RepID=A0AAN7ZK94_9COLE
MNFIAVITITFVACVNSDFLDTSTETQASGFDLIKKQGELFESLNSTEIPMTLGEPPHVDGTALTETTVHSEYSDKVIIRALECKEIGRQIRTNQISIFDYQTIVDIYMASLFRCAILDIDLSDLLNTAKEVHTELTNTGS